MDAKDRREKILTLLRTEARLSAEQIAERLQLTADEVSQVIVACEADDTIHGYYALISETAFAERGAHALIEVSVQPERDTGFDRIAKQLSKFPEVTDVLLVSGSYDLLLMVSGESLHDVADFVASKLSPQEGVRSTRTHFMLKKYKEAGFQLEKDEEHERLSVTP